VQQYERLPRPHILIEDLMPENGHMLAVTGNSG